jgi:hypothetical protein
MLFILSRKIEISSGIIIQRNFYKDFEFYNKKRSHQSLDYLCPLSVYKENLKKSKKFMMLKKTLLLQLEKRKKLFRERRFLPLFRKEML